MTVSKYLQAIKASNARFRLKGCHNGRSSFRRSVHQYCHRKAYLLERWTLRSSCRYCIRQEDNVEQEKRFDVDLTSKVSPVRFVCTATHSWQERMHSVCVRAAQNYHNASVPEPKAIYRKSQRSDRAFEFNGTVVPRSWRSGRKSKCPGDATCF